MDDELKINSNTYSPIESGEKKRKQFRKGHSEYLIDINEFMKMHKEWRQWTQSQRMGFFPIFNKSFLEKLPHITGNAVRLYLFLGAHINNQDGSTTVSIETIMHRFNATKRTVHNWIKELRKHDLILRIQSGFTHPTYTLLLPYHNEFLDERPNMKKLLAEYSDEDLEEDSTEIYDHLNDDPN